MGIPCSLWLRMHLRASPLLARIAFHSPPTPKLGCREGRAHRPCRSGPQIGLSSAAVRPAGRGKEAALSGYPHSIRRERDRGSLAADGLAAAERPGRGRAARWLGDSRGGLRHSGGRARAARKGGWRAGRGDEGCAGATRPSGGGRCWWPGAARCPTRSSSSSSVTTPSTASTQAPRHVPRHVPQHGPGLLPLPVPGPPSLAGTRPADLQTPNSGLLPTGGGPLECRRGRGRGPLLVAARLLVVTRGGTGLPCSRWGGRAYPDRDGGDGRDCWS